MEKRTHLFEFHARNAKVTSFAGFQMPIWFKGIIPEHISVRNSVGIFDVTHMGRVIVSGGDSEKFLNYVTTNDVATLTPLSAHYSTMCNEKGGVKDDFVLSRLEENRFFLVYNAANRSKNYNWLMEKAENFNVEIDDVSENIAMFAVQGPKAQETLQKISTQDLAKIERFKCGWTKLAGFKTFISRTGYTGEDGFEIFIWDTSTSNPSKAVNAWDAIIEAGEEFNIEPCGLGARDTLRLEAGMCLYGNDLDEETTPLEARISFAVKLKKGNFIGRGALLKQKAQGVNRKRVGLKLESGIPRPKHQVYKDGTNIGHVTSGTFSPLLKQGIAMAYVETEHAVRGQEVQVKIRKKDIRAEIIRFPLYDPKKYGYARSI